MRFSHPRYVRSGVFFPIVRLQVQAEILQCSRNSSDEMADYNFSIKETLFNYFNSRHS